MNERIKQLAEQAGFYFYDMHDVDGQDLGETVEADNWHVAEEFAELVIKECVEITLDYKNDQHYQGWLDYQEAIKQHFGLK